MPQHASRITFIMTMTDDQELSVPQTDALFKFSEKYDGFCEILILVGEVKELKMKLTWLAMTLNNKNHPKVRAKMIRYTSQYDLISQIESNVNLALGRKIVVISSCPEVRERIENMKAHDKSALTTQYTFDVNAIHKSVAQAA